MTLQRVNLQQQVDEIAPDGSEIRFLARTDNATMVHCTMLPGLCSTPVEHRTIDEIWYFLSGNGRVWRALDGNKEQTIVEKGVSINIPLHTVFQFENTGNTPLEFIIVSSPPWPGDDETILRHGFFD